MALRKALEERDWGPAQLRDAMDARFGAAPLAASLSRIINGDRGAGLEIARRLQILLEIDLAAWSRSVPRLRSARSPRRPARVAAGVG